MHVAHLHRYPVKGLSPEALDKVELARGSFFPGDRLFAFENGPSSFDPAAPAYQPKTRFLMLMKNARLAELVSRYDDETHTSQPLARRRRAGARGDVGRQTEAGKRSKLFCRNSARARRAGRLRLASRPRTAFASRIRSARALSRS